MNIKGAQNKSAAGCLVPAGKISVLSKNEFSELVNRMPLSPREGQIIEQILFGHSDKQIAINLNMAIPTIRTHLKRIFLKLNVKDKYELILYFFSCFRMDCYGRGCPRKNGHQHR